MVCDCCFNCLLNFMKQNVSFHLFSPSKIFPGFGVTTLLISHRIFYTQKFAEAGLEGGQF